ncbi:MAG: hypothetical protein IJZ94_06185 [Clostridia bacterium]|nr:hypothetical protein [Clostridia bacterium]
MFTGNILNRIKYHFEEAEPYYIVLSVALMAGSCAGAFTLGCLSPELVAELSVIMSNYSNFMSNGSLVKDVFFEGIKGSLNLSLIIYVCSFTPLALASGVFVLSAKGFCIGFMAAGVLKCFALKNAALLLLQSAPCQLFSIAAIYLMSGVGTMNQKVHRSFFQNTILFILIYLIFILGTVCEVIIKC